MVIAGKEQADGTTFVLLGISEANIERLRRGWPIRVRRETHGLAVPEGLVIGIVWGMTERDIAAQLVKDRLLEPDALRQPFPDPEAL
jgi:hypothetical protein